MKTNPITPNGTAPTLAAIIRPARTVTAIRYRADGTAYLRDEQWPADANPLAPRDPDGIFAKIDAFQAAQEAARKS